MLQHHHHQAPQEAAAPTISTSNAEAPPKQVAMAMERLGQAARLIADIRLGADRLLEALFVTAQPHKSSKPVHLFVKEDSSIHQHILNLRSIGRQLQESGVLNESLRSRSNSWGLHMPLVCPDGAVVAYAWKRQLAGQAGASAVDRTRLALKAFTDQKRQFFPHLDDGEAESAAKKCRVQNPVDSKEVDLSDCRTVSDILLHLEKEVPNLKTFTYERLDWLKRATSLPSISNDNSVETRKHNFPTSSILRPGTQVVVAADKVAVVELFFPSVFRAIISLHPAGCTDPDAVAFYSPDEGGSYMHARGSSVYHVFQQITEHAAIALQYFLRARAETAPYTLLHWICGYQTLFSKACSKCGRLLATERQSGLLLPPVCRPFRNFSASKTSIQQISATVEDSSNSAYHFGCFVDIATQH